MDVLATYAIWGVVLFLVVATLLPFLKVGSWPVRLCDFFRLQIASLALLMVLLIAYVYDVRSLNEPLVWISLCAAVGVWQLSHVLPYTLCWRKEVRWFDSDASGSLSVAVVNLKFDNDQKQQLVEQLSHLKVDLLLLIEIDEAWDRALQTLHSRFPHRHGVIREEGLGIMLWSKHPLHEARTRHLVSSDRASIFAKLILNPDDGGQGREVCFVGVHPLPPGLPQDHGTGRHDSRVRDAELMLVAEEVSRAKNRNWVVTGDFNDVAWSHTTRMFQRISGLADPRIGRGLYNTYHAQYPWIRFPIDQVFLSPGARIHRLGRFHPAGSDHFAIITEFSFVTTDPPPEPMKEGDLEEATEMIQEGREDAATN